MDILKRMQKANISSAEIPLLGIDIGGITIKLSFFDIEANLYEASPVNVHDNLAAAKFLETEQVSNRKQLRLLLDQKLKNYQSYQARETRVKNLNGFVYNYLFTRNYFSDFLQELIGLNLYQPYICITGAALVNYLNVFLNDIKARLLILSSENESLVRGIQLLNSQPVSLYYQLVNADGEKSQAKVQPVNPIQAHYPSLATIVGTSTTYLLLNGPNNYTFLGSSAISGQTFVGLINAIQKYAKPDAETKTFDECIASASSGHNDTSVTIRKLCGGSEHKVEQFLYLHNLETGLYMQKADYIKSYGDLPASCFGDVRSDSQHQLQLNDLAAASLDLVCYQIAESIAVYCRAYKVNFSLVVGSFLVNNFDAKYLITKYVNSLLQNNVKPNSKHVYFLDSEANLGSLGCLAVDGQNFQVEPQKSP